MRVLPPATVGILGGGQLGRMIAHQARRMGYRIAILDPDARAPAAQVADDVVVGRLDDAEAALELARRCDVLTVETEHIPWEVLAKVEAVKPLSPRSEVLRTIQDRLRQKEFLAAHGFPQPDFESVHDALSLEKAVGRLGVPSVLKSRAGGYDGRGQARVRDAAAAANEWRSIGNQPAILEQFVPFAMELSVVLARSRDGDVRYYPIAENVHESGILHTTRAPARVPDETAERAKRIAVGIAHALGHVGVIAVEMFLLRDGSLLVNEIAPRVHNSGHYTLGACATSQFEQHLRAVCGLPLGDPTQLRPAVMLNLLGDLWAGGEPDWSLVFAAPEAHLHAYGKRDARRGRKMAHILVLHESSDEAMAIAQRLHRELARSARGTP